MRTLTIGLFSNSQYGSQTTLIYMSPDWVFQILGNIVDLKESLLRAIAAGCFPHSLVASHLDERYANISSWMASSQPHDSVFYGLFGVHYSLAH